MFWESSALVPVVLDEPDSASLLAAFDSDREPSIWWGTAVEAHAAIARAVRDRRITREEATAAVDRFRTIRVEVDEVGPTDDLRSRAVRLLSAHRLRAADALQLAAALFWCEEQPAGESFVCLDKRLREAAQREGFTLLPLDYAERAK